MFCPTVLPETFLINYQNILKGNMCINFCVSRNNKFKRNIKFFQEIYLVWQQRKYVFGKQAHTELYSSCWSSIFLEVLWQTSWVVWPRIRVTLLTRFSLSNRSIVLLKLSNRSISLLLTGQWELSACFSLWGAFIFYWLTNGSFCTFFFVQ